MDTPYSGLKVLELGGVAGMFCGKMLSGLGAEVIKIEKPGGDESRKMGPFQQGIEDAERSLSFAYYNTGKKSITLDITKCEGQKIFKELVKETDVVIETYKPGQMEKLGIGYQDLKIISPGIIMLSITPFGQTGPHNKWNASTDLIVDAMGGPITEVGFLGESPLHLGGDILASMTGLYGLFAVQAAYHNRIFTNQGAHIDVSQQECCLTWKNQALGFEQIYGANPNRRNRDAIRQGLVNCKDGFAFVMIGGKWIELVEWFADMGQDVTVFDDPFYQQYELEALTKWDEVLLARINMLGSNYTKKEFMLEGQRRKIPVGVVEAPKSILENEHFKARDYFVEVEHPVLGSFLYPGAMAKMTKSLQLTDRCAPLLGEHNNEIYSGLGYCESMISELKQEKII